MDSSNVSRSGRIRKKSSKLADFESPDEIEAVSSGKKVITRPPTQATPKSTVMSYNVIDSVPPDQLLAEEDDFDSEDLLEPDDLELTEADLEGLDDLDQDTDEQIDVEEPDTDDGGLMIDEGPKQRKGSKNMGKDKRLSAFMLYAKKMRPKVLISNPSLGFSALTKKLGEMWSNLPNSEKAIWKRKLASMARNVESPQQMVKLVAPVHQSKTAAPTMQILDQITSNSFKVTGIAPIDAAAHLKLLGESLSVIGQRLTEHKGQIAVSGSLSVLLDSLLCAMGPLVCMTKQVPQLQRAIPDEKLHRILDNIAYIMPGL